MKDYEPSTAGESLFLYIYGELASNSCWKSVALALRPTGDSDQYVSYILQHAALYTCSKLISAAKGGSSINAIIQGGAWRVLDTGGKLFRLLSDALANSDTEIASGVGHRLADFARERHHWCYICGISLDFSGAPQRCSFTLDHLWPRAYGGQSVEANLLPACQDCNEKKGSAALWVASDIHAAFLGVNVPAGTLAKLKSERRIALYRRAGVNLAVRRGTTLKKAFLTLGPWAQVSTYDNDAVAEMFNMRIHDDSEVYDEIL